MSVKYWLFKSEPSSFSIDDLAKKPKSTEGWDGVRNYQARNLLRDDIKVGDGVLFYHSSVVPPGIAGICEVVSEAYPDRTALDSSNDHFDPKSSEDDIRWYMLDIQLKTKFTRLIGLPELKQTTGLEKMMVCRRGMRLSIQPVSKKEWQIIQRLADSAAG